MKEIVKTSLLGVVIIKKRGVRSQEKKQNMEGVNLGSTLNY